MIYFLRCDQDTPFLKRGWIKIGQTIRLSVRLKQIAADIGHTPTVLAMLDGTFAEERALHEKFAGVRRSGEWFYPSEELLRLIDREARPWDGTDEVPLSVLGVPVKIDAEVITEAKMVAVSRDVSLTEYLNDLVRPLVKKDLEQEATRRINRE